MFRVAHFSSNANNGANADTFYWNLNNSSTNANRNIGTRLNTLKYSAETPSSPLGEIVDRNSLVGQPKNWVWGHRI